MDKKIIIMFGGRSAGKNWLYNTKLHWKCIKCDAKNFGQKPMNCINCGWHHPDFSDNEWGAGQKQ